MRRERGNAAMTRREGGALPSTAGAGESSRLTGAARIEGGKGAGIPGMPAPVTARAMPVFYRLRGQEEDFELFDGEELPLFVADLTLPLSSSSGTIRGISWPGIVLILSRG